MERIVAPPSQDQHKATEAQQSLHPPQMGAL